MIQARDAEAKVARDGRRWTLRPARPTDGRPLARLFAEVRTEGRWLITTPGSVSEPSEAFWITELIRAAEHLALVAEADGDVVGNVLVNVDRGVATEHIGVLSICIARDWRDVGIGSELVAAAPALVTNDLVDFHVAYARGGVGMTTVAYLADDQGRAFRADSLNAAMATAVMAFQVRASWRP